jgi:hypothetical protein
VIASDILVDSSFVFATNSSEVEYRFICWSGVNMPVKSKSPDKIMASMTVGVEVLVGEGSGVGVVRKVGVDVNVGEGVPEGERNGGGVFVGRVGVGSSDFTKD